MQNSPHVNTRTESAALYRCIGVSLNKGLRKERRSGAKTQCVFVHGGLACLLALLSGCVNSQRPVVGPIQFVTVSGASLPAVSSLAVNGTIYLFADVTNDDEQLGVSWTVNCGSMPPASESGGVISTACGLVSPAQTASGPIPTYPSTGYITAYTAPSAVPKGNTVTITAHATSLPSVTSSVTLTIVAAGQAASPALDRTTGRFSNGVPRAGF